MERCTKIFAFFTIGLFGTGCLATGPVPQTQPVVLNVLSKECQSSGTWPQLGVEVAVFRVKSFTRFNWSDNVIQYGRVQLTAVTSMYGKVPKSADLPYATPMPLAMRGIESPWPLHSVRIGQLLIVVIVPHGAMGTGDPPVSPTETLLLDDVDKPEEPPKVNLGDGAACYVTMIESTSDSKVKTFKQLADLMNVFETPTEKDLLAKANKSGDQLILEYCSERLKDNAK